MAVNFGKFNRAADADASLETRKAPEYIKMPRPEAREIGRKTLDAYAAALRQLQERTEKFDRAFDKANEAAFGANESVFHIKH